MLLRVQALRREGDGFFAITPNRGAVRVSAFDARTIEAVLRRSDRESKPMIATLFPSPSSPT